MGRDPRETGRQCSGLVNRMKVPCLTNLESFGLIIPAAISLSSLTGGFIAWGMDTLSSTKHLATALPYHMMLPGDPRPGTSHGTDPP